MAGFDFNLIDQNEQAPFGESMENQNRLGILMGGRVGLRYLKVLTYIMKTKI